MDEFLVKASRLTKMDEFLVKASRLTKMDEFLVKATSRLRIHLIYNKSAAERKLWRSFLF